MFRLFKRRAYVSRISKASFSDGPKESRGLDLTGDKRKPEMTEGGWAKMTLTRAYLSAQGWADADFDKVIFHLSEAPWGRPSPPTSGSTSHLKCGSTKPLVAGLRTS